MCYRAWVGAYGDLALPIRRDPSLGIAGRTHKRESELIQSGTSAAAGATGSRRITPSNRLLGFTPLAYPFPKRTHEAAWLLNHSWGLVRRHQGAMHAVRLGANLLRKSRSLARDLTVPSYHLSPERLCTGRERLANCSPFREAAKSSASRR